MTTTYRPIKDLFTYIPAEYPELEDDEYECLVSEDYTIQVAGPNTFLINHCEFDENGDLESVGYVGSHRTLSSAMGAVISLLAEKG